MRPIDLRQQRLLNQRLIGTRFKRPEETVRWLGAVQSQDYPGAKWALGQRTRGATDASIDEAFARGSILRTHVLRPTWHFVIPEDIRWMLKLTAPRINARMALYYRQVEIDDALIARSRAIFRKVLRGGKQLTRLELGKALATGGIDASGLRLMFLVGIAELDAIVCSGALKGKQQTYALLDERAPESKLLTRDEALVELTSRYFRSHGPAQLSDFVWWSGLTMADAKRGVELGQSDLAQEVIDGKSYWFDPSMKIAPPASEMKIHLLPNYDEYFIAYKDRTAVAEVALFKQAADAIRFLYGYIAVLNGRLLGGWKRTIEKDRVVVKAKLARPLDHDGKAALNAVAQQYSAYMGKPVEVTVS
ncbi:MAG TPA: winged helix DNA-binding domain-containing protein [Candidatus Dormibacteraeota bacterium]|nr:winged helix DNA-binding domain-containing protein [Candidatus Dormibacteraeota bacterium]